MKKIINILIIILIMLLYYLVSPDTKLLITFNFSGYLLLRSLFSTTSIKDNKNKLFITIIVLLLLGALLSSVFYFLGNVIGIKYLNITNALCIMFLINNININLITKYLDNNKIYNIYYLSILIINIILTIILKTNYHIIYLYITSIVLFIPIFILLYIFRLRKKQDYKLHNIKNILITNKEKAFINIINSSYIYISLIILYYLLNNKYINNNTNIILSNTYFFSLIFIYIIYKILENKLNIEDNIHNYNNIINKILNISLPLSLLLLIISYSLSKVIFNSSYNIIFPLVIVLFFYTLYNGIINISIDNITNKKINISILLGLLVKIIFEIPLINSSYRMGYDLVLGSILSTSLGMIISIIINTFFIKRKYKINLLSNFTNILNIIYSNIIYLLILVLFTLIVKVDNDKYLINILAILFYIFISIIFYIMKKRIKLN